MGKSTTSGIAVLVVNYRSPCLAPVLASLATQTLLPDEVIVVDNASGDASADACADFPFVRLVRLARNTGFAAGNNCAAAIATSPWLALLNHDAFAEPDWIENLARARDENPSFRTFACRLVLAGDPARLDGAGDAYRTDGTAWARLRLEPTGSDGDRPYEVFGGCGAAVLYEARAFREVGGFDERYFCYHEDVDLAFRLQRHDCRCLYVPQAVVRHMGSAVSVRGSDFSDYHAHRNMVWTWAKNHPRPWRYLLAHLGVNAQSILWFTLKGRGAVIARAKWDALRGLPAMIRERRPLRRASAERVMSLMERGNVLRSLWRSMRPQRHG